MIEKFQVSKNKKPLNIGVLVSGNGSNLQAIINSIEKKALNASIRVVISNNPNAYAIERAKKYSIPNKVVEDGRYSERKEYDTVIAEVLLKEDVELVVLAGFMRVLSPEFIRRFPMRIMNIHPAILPSFPGLHVQKKAIDYGVRFSGCTVHFVDEGVDTGPIIIQAVVPVHTNDTEEELSKRILEQEHRIYPEAIRLFAEGRLTVSGRRVIISDCVNTRGVLVNPPITI